MGGEEWIMNRGSLLMVTLACWFTYPCLADDKRLEAPNPQADGCPAEEASSADGWHLSLTPQVWFLMTDGEVADGRVWTEMDSAIDDCLGDLDFTFAGHVEARHGALGLFVDGFYLDQRVRASASSRLRPDVENGPTSIPNPGAFPASELDSLLDDFSDVLRDLGFGDVLPDLQGLDVFDLLVLDTKVETELKLTELELALFYQLFRISLGGDRGLALDLYAGGRYTSLRLRTELQIQLGTVDLLPEPIRNETRYDWFELLGGGRVRLDLSDWCGLQVRGDVGGYGIGSSSRLTWQVVGGLQLVFFDHLSLDVGYRFYAIDYERSNLDMDLILHGPTAGLGLRF
jgi:hypothetical protein